MMRDGTREVDMSYHKMTGYFRIAEQYNVHISGYIVFSSTSFREEYSLESRAYEVSSRNEAFQPGMGGYSIYGGSVDGTDPCVRLERYMALERGGPDGWQIERCYMRQEEPDKVKPLVKQDKERGR